MRLTQAQLSLIVALISGLASFALIRDPMIAKVAGLVTAVMVLWLWEALPTFVPTLLLWIGIPLLLAGDDPRFALPKVLHWSLDPVLALFFGGFVLAQASRVTGLDHAFAAWLVRISKQAHGRLVAAVGLGTAFLSMWMSNVAAAALMLGTLRPLLNRIDDNGHRSLLLALALGANLGGMATPLGSGPNAIAEARVSEMGFDVSFVDWMILVIPLVLALMGFGLALVLKIYPSSSKVDLGDLPEGHKHRGRRRFLAIFAFAVLAWLSESWHGLSPALIALTAATFLFLTQVLHKSDLAGVDGGSLLLIAGGLTMGKLLESTGVLEQAAKASFWADWPLWTQTSLLLGAAALLSALMSNTATATLLVPLAAHIDSSLAGPILVAVACSLGMPFTISTPPNAMVVAEGTLKGRDLLRIGLPVMIIGLILIIATGRMFLLTAHGG